MGGFVTKIIKSIKIEYLLLNNIDEASRNDKRSNLATSKCLICNDLMHMMYRL